MLLIDNRKTEGFECDFLLEESVRSDDELDVAVAQSGLECAAFAGSRRAGRFRHDHGMVK